MSRMRPPRIHRPLPVSAALGLAVLTLVVGTATRADARPMAAVPAAAILNDTFPPSWLPTTPPPSPSLPPGTPGSLRVTATRSTSVTLAWTASTPGCCPLESYDITHYEAYNDLIRIEKVGNVTSYTFTGLRPTSEHSFTVRARDVADHTSDSSNSVHVVTPATDVGPDTTPPSEPTDVRLAGVSAEGAQLSWSPSTDDVGVTGYTVYGFDGLFISTPLATVTETSATVPVENRYFSYYVRARDAAGNLSFSSDPVSVPRVTTPPTTPSTAPLSCRAAYRTGAQWTGGFVADVQVTNSGSRPISDWTVGFRFGGDQQIDSSWSATFQQSGAEVTLKPMQWNRTIAAGTTIWLGMLGHWTASNAAPAAITVDGVPCTTS